jgi:hypothetical protein
MWQYALSVSAVDRHDRHSTMVSSILCSVYVEVKEFYGASVYTAVHMGHNICERPSGRRAAMCEQTSDTSNFKQTGLHTVLACFNA